MHIAYRCYSIYSSSAELQTRHSTRQHILPVIALAPRLTLIHHWWSGWCLQGTILGKIRYQSGADWMSRQSHEPRVDRHWRPPNISCLEYLHTLTTPWLRDRVENSGRRNMPRFWAPLHHQLKHGVMLDDDKGSIQEYRFRLSGNAMKSVVLVVSAITGWANTLGVLKGNSER